MDKEIKLKKNKGCCAALTFDGYENLMMELRKYPGVGENIYYPTLGLTGEAGEVADKVKKVMRDADGIMTDDRRYEIAKEVGDVVWYVCALANELGFSFEDIAQMNIDKLLDRKVRNVIKGDGDNR